MWNHERLVLNVLVVVHMFLHVHWNLLHLHVVYRVVFHWYVDYVLLSEIRAKGHLFIEEFVLLVKF